MMIRAAIVIVLALVLSSCASSRGPRGGDPERQLGAATAADDLAKVTQLLAAGADPNKMVEVDGNDLSPWSIALRQSSSQHPQRVATIRAMLAAGANPTSAWGDASPRPAESFWQSLRHARNAGISNESPLRLAMLHPDVEIVRALIAAGITAAQATSELVDAVEAGEDEIARLLVEAGANVNTHSGATTALVAAVARRDVPMMQFLEEHGAREKP